MFKIIFIGGMVGLLIYVLNNKRKDFELKEQLREDKAKYEELKNETNVST